MADSQHMAPLCLHAMADSLHMALVCLHAMADSLHMAPLCLHAMADSLHMALCNIYFIIPKILLLNTYQLLTHLLPMCQGGICQGRM